jgi:hypothetical protein
MVRPFLADRAISARNLNNPDALVVLKFFFAPVNPIMGAVCTEQRNSQSQCRQLAKPIPARSRVTAFVCTRVWSGKRSADREIAEQQGYHPMFRIVTGLNLLTTVEDVKGTLPPETKRLSNRRW